MSSYVCGLVKTLNACLPLALLVGVEANLRKILKLFIRVVIKAYQRALHIPTIPTEPQRRQQQQPELPQQRRGRRRRRCLPPQSLSP